MSYPFLFLTLMSNIHLTWYPGVDIPENVENPRGIPLGKSETLLLGSQEGPTKLGQQLLVVLFSNRNGHICGKKFEFHIRSYGEQDESWGFRKKICELSRCPIVAHLSSFGIWVRSVIKLQQRTFDMYRYLNMGCNRVTKNVQAQSAMSKPGLFTWLCSKWIQMG